MTRETIRYVHIQGEHYANVNDVAAALREKGYTEVAEWLQESALGPVTSIKSVRIR